MNTTPSASSQPRLAGWLADRFTGPRLPKSILLLVTGTIVTHAVLLLVIQPAAYWLAPRMALRPFSPDWLTTGLLTRGPWLFAAAALLYLLTASLLLARLNRSAALTLAGMLFFFHLFNIEVLLAYGPGAFWIGFDVVFILVILLALIEARLVPFDCLAKLPLGVRRWLPALPRLERALAAAWLVFLAIMIAQNAVLPRAGWRPLAPRQMPSARNGMAVAYDTHRNRAVMFGGLTVNELHQTVYSTETWEWDGNDWLQVHTDDAPSGRWFPSMAYDEARGVVVLYGGANQSGTLMDLWEYDGKRWKWLCPTCNPAARWGATMVYDPALKQVVFYGGVGPGKDGAETWYSEAWSWNGNSWNLQPIHPPSPTSFHPALAYDPGQQRILAFVDQADGGAWFWKENTWTHPNLAAEPPRSKSAQMIYDPLYARAVLFGGIQENAYGAYAKTTILLDETWVYEKDAWHKLSPSAVLAPTLSPPARQDHIAFYDPTRRGMIVFGGRTTDKPLGDMWELPLGSPTPGMPAKEAK